MLVSYANSWNITGIYDFLEVIVENDKEKERAFVEELGRYLEKVNLKENEKQLVQFVKEITLSDTLFTVRTFKIIEEERKLKTTLSEILNANYNGESYGERDGEYELIDRTLDRLDGKYLVTLDPNCGTLTIVEL